MTETKNVSEKKGRLKKGASFFKRQGFITGALTLAGASVICRLIGVGFRIPLANLISNFGMGLYQMVFPIYSLLLVISSAGIPIAISKLVAKQKAENDDLKACRRILVNALILLAVIGTVVTAAFFGTAHLIADIQGNQGVTKIYYAIAPAVFFVCLIGAFRG